MVRVLLFTGVLFLFISVAKGQTEQDIVSFLEKAKVQMNLNPKEGKKYLDSLDNHFQSNPNPSFLKAKYHLIKGIYQYRQANMDSSIYYYKKADEYFSANDSTFQMAKVRINLAMCHNYKGDYEKTIEAALEALRLFEQLDDLKGISISNNIIAHVYFARQDHKSALSYMKKYLQNAMKSNDTGEIISAYNNIGATFTAMKQYDSSNFYLEKALALTKADRNLLQMSSQLENIGGNHMEMKHYEEAFKTFSKALEIAGRTNDSTSIARIHNNLGKINTRLGNHQQAYVHISKASKIFTQLGNRSMMRNAFREMYHHFEAVGNYQKALVYYKKSDSLSEVLFNEESDRNIEELRTQYETEKKDKQIKLQNAEIVQKDLEIQRNYLVLGGLILLIIIASLFIYLRYLKIKQKQALVLEQTRRELERKQTQSLIQSQEQERRRFATDLHDGMGQLISALSLNLQGLKENQSRKLHDHSQSLLSEIHGEIRNIAFNLMPQILTKEGLVPALRHLLKRIEKSGKIQTGFDAYDMDFRFSKDAEVSVYRIVQELLSNITKYSGAQNISLQIVGHEESVVLMIEDDGFGYDLNEFKNSEGNGWRNISFRLGMLGGDIEIDTRKGEQTSVVTIEIPLKRTP